MPVYDTPGPDCQTPVSRSVEQSKHHKERLAQWCQDRFIRKYLPQWPGVFWNVKAIF